MSDDLLPLDQIERQKPVESIRLRTGAAVHLIVMDCRSRGGHKANECELVTA